jgi:hypothetical protein
MRGAVRELERRRLYSKLLQLKLPRLSWVFEKGELSLPRNGEQVR